MSNDAPKGRQVGVHFEGDLRSALLAAAVTEIEAVGVNQLSLRQVARRTGVSHAAPAHHFGDKTGLLTSIATEGFVVLTSRLDAASSPDRNALAQLDAHGEAYAAFAQDHPGYFDVMFRPSVIRSDDPAYLTASREAYATLHRVVTRCQALGWRPDEDAIDLTTATWALIHGLSVLRGSRALEPQHPDAGPRELVALAAALIAP